MQQQRWFALLVPKWSGGTIICPLNMTFKMAATATAASPGSPILLPWVEQITFHNYVHCLDLLINIKKWKNTQMSQFFLCIEISKATINCKSKDITKIKYTLHRYNFTTWLLLPSIIIVKVYCWPPKWWVVGRKRDKFDALWEGKVHILGTFPFPQCIILEINNIPYRD